MNNNQVSGILNQVPKLRPIAEKVAAGDIRVEQRKLPDGVQALYVPTAGNFKQEPSIEDAILINDRPGWDPDNSIYQRSILVHEAYHGLDDLNLAGHSTGHLESEVRAWTGQLAYIAEQIAATADLKAGVEQVIQDAKTSGMAEMEMMTMVLALRTASVCPAATAAAALLEQRFLECASGITGIDQLLQNPAESLNGALGLIYFGSSKSEIELNGISPKSV